MTKDAMLGLYHSTVWPYMLIKA